MKNSREVDKAVIAVLAHDAALSALMPGGVWWGVADAPDRFVLVVELDHADDYALPGRTVFENFLYLIKAVAQGSSAGPVLDAEHRIADLLDNQVIHPPGYWPSTCCRRTRRFRPAPAIDDTTNQRWHECGGWYDVRITPQ